MCIYINSLQSILLTLPWILDNVYLIHIHNTQYYIYIQVESINMYMYFCSSFFYFIIQTVQTIFYYHHHFIWICFTVCLIVLCVCTLLQLSIHYLYTISTLCSHYFYTISTLCSHYLYTISTLSLHYNLLFVSAIFIMCTGMYAYLCVCVGWCVGWYVGSVCRGV